MTYLEMLAKKRIIPNFWCSTEYFKFAGWVEESFEKEEMICISESFNLRGETMLPPIGNKLSEFGTMRCNEIWADFPHSFYFDGKSQFLDYNYIYAPKNFLDMSGKKWATFRKNVRKWPERNPNWGTLHIKETLLNEYDVTSSHITTLLIKWLEAREVQEEIYDDEIMASFVLKGQNRMLYYNGDKLVGINVWDENHMFVNFRYCISDPEEPFLNEFMRYNFYLQMNEEEGGKLVNDGGVLDNPHLERFKDKLNPVMKYKINTWRSK